MNSETKNCQNCKNSFTIEPADFDFYKKMEVPAPTLCPDCRLKRRLLWRNERNFYKRSCNFCKKNMISLYPADAPFPVYCVKCWWSDSWDPYQYGRDFDFSRPFFEQLKELLQVVPELSIMNDNGVASVNCEYTYDWLFSKNCYMTVCGWFVENGMYLYHTNRGKDIVDCFHVDESELMYECVNCQGSYGCSYCTDCVSSNNCIGGFDLHGCSDCAFSVGLRNKKFHIFNEPYSEQEYRAKLKEMGIGTRQFYENGLKRQRELVLKHPHKYAIILKSVNTTGHCLRNCKNAHASFYQNTLENCKYMVVGDSAKDSFDCNHTGKPELCYECVTPDEGYRNIATIFCYKSENLEYSHYCKPADNCFGCISLKKGSYAILNKRYPKEEYEKLRVRIIEYMKKTGEWGEFFPHWVSPFAYNETAAQEWFPLEKAEALKRGYQWKEPDAKAYTITLKPDQLPNSIQEVSDNILKEVIGCAHEGKCNEKCTTAFKLIPAELQFYRRVNLPIPKLCPNCRHYVRLKRRNPPKLWHRQCMCDRGHDNHKTGRCPNEFETSYAPERPEIIYCEQCYQGEIV